MTKEVLKAAIRERWPGKSLKESQQQAADAMGISLSYVRALGAGYRKPSREALSKIRKFLPTVDINLYL